jgi:secondary thiamine-phosphate synthase enzyme
VAISPSRHGFEARSPAYHQPSERSTGTGARPFLLAPNQSADIVFADTHHQDGIETLGLELRRPDATADCVIPRYASPGGGDLLGDQKLPGDRDLAQTETMKTLELQVDTSGRRGLWDLTAACARFAAGASNGGDGLLVVFVPHATAGLVVVELGAGSDVDVMAALDRLLPREDARYRHRHGSAGHGADHVLPLFAAPSLTVPVTAGELALGTWQSIALLDPNADNDRRSVRLSFVPVQ